MRVLAIGAHPDDIELGCGGALIKHSKKGDEVFLLVVCKGNLGGSVKVRIEEQKKAANILGAKKLFFGGKPDALVPNDYSTIRFLEKYITKVSPTLIYTHSKKDHHQDHRTLADCTLSAARYVQNLLAYETPSTTHEFMPTVFVDITDVFDLKIKSIEMHSTQIKRCTFVKIANIKSVAKFRGSQARTEYAEGFEPVRIMI
jgi:LmbE family N-acetylglucosaminyl deacetylase